jgi:hypothetical protein
MFILECLGDIGGFRPIATPYAFRIDRGSLVIRYLGRLGSAYKVQIHKVILTI